MITINAQGLIAKLKKAEEIIREKVELELQDIGESMKRDIVDQTTRSYSPSWQAAPEYFKAHRGYLNIIERMPIDVINHENKISIGFGKISFLNELTIEDSGGKEKGYPYWRLFEYGTIGQRQGGSSKYGFFPFEGYGHQGLGWARKVSKNIKPNPGVRPVHLFDDTLQYYKKSIKTRIQSRIKKELKVLNR